MSGGAPSARLRTLAGQSAIYGVGPVVARFAGLLLLPIYARHLGTAEVGRVGQMVALVAVGATIAQLGLVNALFRFAAEREGDERFAVARTALAICTVSGVALALIAALATPVAAPLCSARATSRCGSLAAPACSSRCSTSRARASIASSSARSASSPSRSSTSP